jgi:hypothetical protein
MDQMLCASRGCLAPRAIAYRGGFRKLRTILTPNGDLGKPRAWRTQRVDVQQGSPIVRWRAAYVWSPELPNELKNEANGNAARRERTRPSIGLASPTFGILIRSPPTILQCRRMT